MLNVKVNTLLRKWVVDEIKEEDMKMCLTSDNVTQDLTYSYFCRRAGSILKDLGILEVAGGALEHAKKALSIQEKVLEKHSPDLAASYNNIAMVLKDKGDLDGALEYFKTTLSIFERVLDKHSPSLASSYNNIGMVLTEKGDLDGALAYYKKALSIEDKVLDKNSPS